MLPEKVRVLLWCLCIVTMFMIPVHADIGTVTVTHVYFDKDGLPYNGSVSYTVTCFRNNTPSTSEPGQSPAALQSEKVFSYSASCPEYGCPIYNSYYKTEWMSIDWCDLNGETRGKKFTIHHYSSLPYNGTCDQLPVGSSPLIRDYPEPRTRYYVTQEYYACNHYSVFRNQSSTIYHVFADACNLTKDPGCFAELLPSGIPVKNNYGFETVKNRTELDFGQYIQYLETCDPVTDPDCPGLVIAGTPLKKMYELRPLRNSSISLRDPCDTFLVRLNRSLDLTREQMDQSDGHYTDIHVQRLCDSRWAIPSDTFTQNIPSTFNQVPYVPRSPVESLYCWLVKLSGGKCE